MASAVFFCEEGSQWPQIISARRHSDILQRMAEKGIEYDRESSVQGFLTDQKRFVDRREAAEIAKASGQVGSGFRGKELFSEDIWKEEANGKMQKLRRGNHLDQDTGRKSNAM